MSKTGRPKGTNNMKYICTIRMDEATLKRLESYCRKMGILKSQAIREAIYSLSESKNIID